MKDKLSQAIDKYLFAEGTNRRIGSAKARLTKLVDELWHIGNDGKEIRKLALELLEEKEYVPDRTKLLRNRFTYGSLYLESDRVFGWWNPDAPQAEQLPLAYSAGTWIVSFWAMPAEAEAWEYRGFLTAQDLPLTRRVWSPENQFNLLDIWEVKFPVKLTHFWLEYGYALPCKLQWHRDNEGLFVDRSILSAGYWQAWKWWAGARDWYLEKRPELFADMPWWGDYDLEAPIRYEPEDDLYAAVLGGK